jgi:TolA-binding protein
LEWDSSNKPLLNYLNIYEEDASNAVELDEVSEKWIHWPALPRIRLAWLLSGVLCTVLLVQGVSYLVGQRDYDVEQSGKNKQQVEYFQEKIEKGNQPQMVLLEKPAVGFLPEEVKNRGEENSMAGADYDLEQEKWYYSEGYQAYLAGDYKKATSNLGMVVSMQSKSFLHREALYYLARVYYINSEYKNAEKYFLDYTRDFPSTNYYDESLFYLGCIYYFDQQEDKARQALEKLREVVPDSGYLTSKMAITLLGAQ